MEQDLSQYQYQVLVPNDDYKQALIEKKNITASFTLADVEQNVKTLEKIVRECTAQIEVDEATCANIMHFNTGIAELSDEFMNAVSMYYTAKQKIQPTKDRLAKAQEIMTSEQAEFDHIKAQFGFTDPEPVKEPADEVQHGENLVKSPIQQGDLPSDNGEGGASVPVA